MPSTVCVVIVTKDRKDDLMRLLGSLAGQARVPDGVVIVDSSREPLLKNSVNEALKGKCSSIEIIHRECSLPEGRNIGIDAAKCDLVSFIDDDAVLDPGYFREIVRHFEEDPSRSVGGVEGEIVNLPSSKLNRYRIIYAFNALFFLSFPGRGTYRLSGLARPLVRSASPARVEVLNGSNMTFRRDVLERFRFDESLKGGRFSEDLDISRRISREYELYHVPGARLDHLVVQKARASSSAAAIANLRNLRRLHLKNFDQDFKSRLAFRISVLGMFVHLFMDRQVDAIKPFLETAFRG